MKPRCRECGGSLVLKNGEYVCSKCGLVQEVEMVSPYYVLGVDEKGPSPSIVRSYVHYGERAHLVDGLGSFVGSPFSFFFKDKYGKPLKDQERFAKMKALYDKKLRYMHKTFSYHTFMAIAKVSALMGLPKEVRDYACLLYRNAFRKGGKRTSSMALAAASLYMAAKQFDPTSNLNIRKIVSAFRTLGHKVSTSSVLHALLEYKPYLKCVDRFRRSEDYVPYFVDTLLNTPYARKKMRRHRIDPVEHKKRLLRIASFFLSKFDKRVRGGKSPKLFAAVVVYLADRYIAKQMGKPQVLPLSAIANLTGLSEYSLRDHVEQLKKILPRIVEFPLF